MTQTTATLLDKPLSILTAVAEVMDAAEEVFQVTLNTMDLIEASNKSMTGKEKLDWVLAFVRDFAFKLGLDWTGLLAKVERFITAAKNIYNIARALKK